MANENRASYFIIGLTVMLGLAATVATLVYIGGLRDRGDEILVETYYDKPVSGLSVGSVVNFRGVKVGEVREISFVGSKYDVEGIERSHIYILMALNRKLLGVPQDVADEGREILKGLVSAGLKATVSSNGITGIARIECDISTDTVETLALSWKPEHVYIPPKVSLLDSFSVSATKVMNQINRMDLNAFWSNINASVESLSALTMSSRHLMESYQPEVERMVKNLEEASASLKVFSDTIRENPATLLHGREAERLTETER